VILTYDVIGPNPINLVGEDMPGGSFTFDGSDNNSCPPDSMCHVLSSVLKPPPAIDPMP
jgi:hypothetical protein